jgi:hypothetical protein
MEIQSFQLLIAIVLTVLIGHFALSHMVQGVDLSNSYAQIVPKVYKYTQKYNIFSMLK